MRARSSAKLCLPAIVLLLLQPGQMLVIKGIGDRDHLFVKPPVAGLDLLGFGKGTPPAAEFVRIFDRPFYQKNTIPFNA
jgi:hypothetical protein